LKSGTAKCHVLSMSTRPEGLHFRAGAAILILSFMAVDFSAHALKMPTVFGMFLL